MNTGRGFIEKSALEGLGIQGGVNVKPAWRRIPYTAHDFGHSFILQVFSMFVGIVVW